MDIFFKRFLIGNFSFDSDLMKKQSLNFPGQTLIETLAALAILSIVIIAIATSVITSLSNAEFNQNQTLATKYTQQGIEIVTEIRDTNYTSFANYSGLYCLASGQTTFNSPQTSCSTNIGSTFSRSVQITQNGCATNVAKITVMTSFTDSKCQANANCHSETDISCLSTVNPIQTP